MSEKSRMAEAYDLGFIQTNRETSFIRERSFEAGFDKALELAVEKIEKSTGRFPYDVVQEIKKLGEK